MKNKFLGLLTLFFLSPLVAEAHIRMITPLPRLDVDNLKQNNNNPDPCGNQARGNNPYVYRPGEVVTFQFRETINHPGRFRIQFSPANDQGFADAGNQLALLEDTMSGGTRTMTAAMPNAECTTCSLRVTQEMDDQPGELYVHCIDINIAAAPVDPPVDPPPVDPPPGGGDQGSQDVSSQSVGLDEPEKPGFGGCGSINAKGPPSGGPWLLLLFLLPLLQVFFGLRQSREV